jgi:excinuclease UvrABC nuclease subunit
MLAPVGDPHSVYRFYNADGELLWVGCTANLFSRLLSHRSGSPFHTQIASVQLEHFDSRTEARAAETAYIETLRPAYNIEHNGSVNKHGNWVAVAAKMRAADPKRKEVA